MKLAILIAGFVAVAFVIGFLLLCAGGGVWTPEDEE